MRKLPQVIATVPASLVLVAGFISKSASPMHVVFKEEGRVAIVHFSHDGLNHSYHLIVTSIFAAGAETVAHTDTGVQHLHLPSAEAETFRGRFFGHHAVARVSSKGLVHGFFVHDGRIIKVEPVRESEFSQSTLPSLSRDHKIQYMLHPGTAHPRSIEAVEQALDEAIAATESTRMMARRLSATSPPVFARSSSSLRAQHRLIFDIHQDVSTPAQMLNSSNDKVSLNDPKQVTMPKWQGERWFPGCYSGDSHLHDFVIGIVVDNEAWKKHADGIFRYIEDTVSLASLVYEVQLHIRILVGHMKVYTSAVAAPPYAVGCPAGATRGTFLTKLRQLGAHSDMPFMGSTVMFTGCGGTKGTMGMAYVGSICSRDGTNVAITGMHSYSIEKTFHSFAHELGHTFGAGHSFEEGRGTTGGIMDYGSAYLGGVYQFNTKYRKKEMCAVADDYVNRCRGKFQRAPEGATARPPPAPRSKEDVCFTVGRRGVGRGKRCVFPFVYKGNTYHGCTLRNNFRIWCATQVDWGDVAVPGKWAECPWIPLCIGPHKPGFGLLEWSRVSLFATCIMMLAASFWRCVRERPRLACTHKSAGEVIGAEAGERLTCRQKLSGEVIGAETGDDVAVATEEPGSDVHSDAASLLEEIDVESDVPSDAASLLEDITIGSDVPSDASLLEEIATVTAI